MLLALDIGNTEITLGLFQGDTLLAQWRLTTHPDRTPDEWAGAVGDVLVRAGNSPNEVRAVCLASVAPAVTQSVVSGVARATGRTAVAVDASSPLPVRLDVDEPLSVGADRIVNVLAAVELYREDVIVVDFGLARPGNPSKSTQTGALMGTMAYVAPEVLRGEAASDRSDLYSLGVVLYEMLTGQLPFVGDRLETVMYAVLHTASVPPSESRKRSAAPR